MNACQHCGGPLEACRLGCLKATLALPAPAPAPDTLPADTITALLDEMGRAPRPYSAAQVMRWVYRAIQIGEATRLAAPDAGAGLEGLAAGMSYDPGLMTRDPVAFARVATGYLTRAAAHGAAEERAKLLQACELAYNESFRADQAEAALARVTEAARAYRAAALSWAEALSECEDEEGVAAVESTMQTVIAADAALTAALEAASPPSRKATP